MPDFVEGGTERKNYQQTLDLVRSAAPIVLQSQQNNSLDKLTEFTVQYTNNLTVTYEKNLYRAIYTNSFK